MFLLRVGVAAAVLALAIPDARSEEAIDDVAQRAPRTVAAAERPKAQAVPEVTLSARIDLSSQRMHVSVNGTPTYSWAISSGRAGYRTPTGSFRPQWTARMWYSRKYDMAPMPHAVFFNGGIAVHATSAVGMLGRPASHGCIRLAPGNAATFFNLVARHGKGATRIVVHGSPRNEEPAVASRKRKTDPRYARSPRNIPAGYAVVQQRRAGQYAAVQARRAPAYQQAPRVIRYQQAYAPSGLLW